MARSVIRRLVSLARPELGRLSIGIAALVVGSAVSLLYPQGMRLVIDIALGHRPAWAAGLGAQGFLGLLIALMAGAAVVSAAAMAVRFYLFTLAGERTVARLREALFAAFLAQEVAFFDGERTGELLSRITSDTSVIQNAVSINVSMALRYLVQLLGGVVLLFVTSPRLAALMVAVVPAIALGAVGYGKKVRKLAKEAQAAQAEASGVAEEALGALRTVRAFAAEPVEATRYGVANQRALAKARHRLQVSAIFMSVTTLAGYLAVALVFWYGGHLVLAGTLSAGALTSFLVYTLIVGFSLGAVADLWADFMRAGGAAERVFEILDRVPALPASGGATPASVAGKVELDHVSFAYPSRPDTPVLRELDLVLAPGQSLALVGASGAGKSTVAGLLLRFYDPQGGAIRLDGRDLRELDPSWLRRQIGTVSQEPVLFSSSILDNLRYGRPDASPAEAEAAARAANADGFIRGFPEGYATRVGERGVQLSGGQRQRIAIARALLKDPRILVLDEATSALDAESEHLVKEALERLMRGRTTLIIAHRLSTVRDADCVVVLDGGRAVDRGRHDELVGRDGLYRKLVERQLAGLG